MASRRRVVVCALGLLAFLCSPALPAGARSAAALRTAVVPRRAAVARRLVRIGSAPVLPAGTQPLAVAATASQKLRVTVALAPRNPAALTAYAIGVENPRSPDYREYLSTRAFARRFGPSATTIHTVESALARAGLSPRGLRADHLSLDIVADAASYERAFHLRLAHVLLPSRRAVLVNLQAPALPASVAGDIQAVVGLDGLQTMRSSRERPTAQKSPISAGDIAGARSPATITPQRRHASRTLTACPAASRAAQQQGAYTAVQIASAYGFDGLFEGGDEGAGVNIGVYELEPNAPADISAYQACYGTSASVAYTDVDGGSGTGAGSGEAAFDIEQIIGLAPRANIIVYRGPNSNSDNPGSGPYDIFATMISQDRVAIISNSWGECEAEEGSADAHAENTLFEEAATQGQSVLSAAGDYGSEDCDGATANGAETLAVDDPGSQPFVTDVGGTSLSALGPPATEITWNVGGGPSVGASNGAGAGGGGISKFWTMPLYQSSAPPSLNVVSADSSTAPCGTVGDCREVPDVSADADPAHGYLIYYNGNDSVPDQPRGWQASGGTSGAAPLWAAVFADADADAACAGTPIGFANPALYRAAAAGASASASASADTGFHDITSGENDFTGAAAGLYPATASYDMASGLGSPNVTALATELCEESLRLTAPASLESFVASPRTLRVSAADTDPTVTVSVTGLPSGVSFDPGTGEITGAPTVPGSSSVTVAAVDSTGALRSATFVWDVAARPKLTHLSLTGAAAARPVLSLRFTSGRSQAPLRQLAVELPAGLRLVHAAQVTVTALSGDKPIRATVSGAGRRVKIVLKSVASPVVVRFGAGALAEAGTLRAAAGRAHKPTYGVAAVVLDADGEVSTVRGSASVAT